MRKLMLVGVIGLAAAAAACSKPASEGVAPAAAGGEAAGAGGSASAVTQALEPKRKAGLWQMAMSSTGGPGVSLNAQMCVDAASASDFNVQAGANKDCANSKLTRVANGWAFESVCKMGGSTMTSRGTVTGDMSSDYAMEMSSRMDPPPSGMPADTKTRVQAKWLGPCPPGMKPGAMKLGGMNIGG